MVWKLDYGLGTWWMCSAAYSCPHINVYDKCTKWKKDVRQLRLPRMHEPAKQNFWKAVIGRSHTGTEDSRICACVLHYTWDTWCSEILSTRGIPKVHAKCFSKIMHGILKNHTKIKYIFPKNISTHKLICGKLQVLEGFLDIWKNIWKVREERLDGPMGSDIDCRYMGLKNSWDQMQMRRHQLSEREECQHAPPLGHCCTWSMHRVNIVAKMRITTRGYSSTPRPSAPERISECLLWLHSLGFTQFSSNKE